MFNKGSLFYSQCGLSPEQSILGWARMRWEGLGGLGWLWDAAHKTSAVGVSPLGRKKMLSALVHLDTVRSRQLSALVRMNVSALVPLDKSCRR
jgi:hypothetical protein